MKVTSSVEIKVLGGNVVMAHIFDDGDTCKLIIEHERFEPFSVEVENNTTTEKVEPYNF